MQKIIASVGRGGRNHTADVRVVQQLLNRHKIIGHTKPLKTDGIVGLNTVSQIEDFQKAIVKMIRPDGRVDPNGRSMLLLNKMPNTTIKPPKVTYSSKISSSQQIVSTYAISVIQLALRNAGMSQAVITSTIRTPDEQARIMYGNAKKNLTGQFKLYGSTGDEVLKVYKANQTLPEPDVIKLMKQKIESLLKQGRRTSKHVVTESYYKNHNIIDIGVNSTRAVSGVAFNIEKFTKALSDLQTKGYISKLIDETKKSNTCWHIEITPNIKPLPHN
ncbi:MAG: peptidoglycan-binding domain-containing protein [Gammaproteobacteria bacterium]|nr:peptidoglycan-binding domain-containing protein [Gammaproteobacteria bacterium]